MYVNIPPSSPLSLPLQILLLYLLLCLLLLLLLLSHLSFPLFPPSFFPLLFVIHLYLCLPIDNFSLLPSPYTSSPSYSTLCLFTLLFTHPPPHTHIVSATASSIPPSSFLLPYPWSLSLSSSPIICNHLTSPSLLSASTPLSLCSSLTGSFLLHFLLDYPPPTFPVPYPPLLPATCYFLLSSPFPPCPLLFPAFASCFFLSPPFPFSPFSSLLVCRPVLSLSIPPSVSPLLHPCPPLLSYFSSFIFPP